MNDYGRKRLNNYKQRSSEFFAVFYLGKIHLLNIQEFIYDSKISQTTVSRINEAIIW